jgi:hypothetical protein
VQLSHRDTSRRSTLSHEGIIQPHCMHRKGLLLIFSSHSHSLPIYLSAVEWLAYSLLARVARLTTTGVPSLTDASAMTTGSRTGAASTATGAGSLGATALVLVFLTWSLADFNKRFR